MRLPNKETMLKAIHKLYRKDKWLNEIFNASGISLDEVSDELDIILGNNYFDTADESAINDYETQLAITPRADQSLDDRRKAVRAKWVGQGKCTLELMQTVVDSWKNGAIELEFIEGRIHVKFVSPIGIPSDLQALKDALEYVKPAHLAIYYTFLYLTWGEAKSFGTWGDHKSKGAWLYVKQLKEG